MRRRESFLGGGGGVWGGDVELRYSLPHLGVPEAVALAGTTFNLWQLAIVSTRLPETPWVYDCVHL